MVVGPFFQLLGRSGLFLFLLLYRIFASHSFPMSSNYDLLAQQYNVTRKADPYLAERLYDKLDPQADEIYLDLGCGSGNYTHSLLSKGVNILGLDPSKEMLAIAVSKGKPENWTQGRAEAIPFPKDHFNGGVLFLTIHHWQDLEQGFAELFRVCKKGSRIILFSSCKEQMEHYWLRHYFPKMMEASIKTDAILY